MVMNRAGYELFAGPGIASGQNGDIFVTHPSDLFPYAHDLRALPYKWREIRPWFGIGPVFQGILYGL